MSSQNFKVKNGLTVNGTEVIDSSLSGHFDTITANTFAIFGGGTVGGSDQYARDTANAAFYHSNNVILIAQGAFDTGNTALACTISVGTTTSYAFGHANAAYENANSSWSSATSSFGHANASFDTANTAFACTVVALTRTSYAFAHANAAYDAANTVASDLTSANTWLQSYTNSTNTWLQSYTNTQVASIVDSAPTTLDTLNELAAALGDDANFATTTSNLIGVTRAHANAAYDAANTTNVVAQSAFDAANTKLSTSGGTISGNVTVQGIITCNTLVSGANTNLTIKAPDNIQFVGIGGEQQTMFYAGQLTDHTTTFSSSYAAQGLIQNYYNFVDNANRISGMLFQPGQGERFTFAKSWTLFDDGGGPKSAIPEAMADIKCGAVDCTGISSYGDVAIYANSEITSLGVGTSASGTTGEIRATNNITAYYSSDKKLKENIKDVENPLDIVCAIGSKTFDWTDEYIAAHGGEDNYFLRKSDFGVIAQDVQSVFPQAVRTRQDGTLAVDYEKLAVLSFGAIKELVERIENLESK